MGATGIAPKSATVYEIHDNWCKAPLALVSTKSHNTSAVLLAVLLALQKLSRDAGLPVLRSVAAYGFEYGCIIVPHGSRSYTHGAQPIGEKLGGKQ